MSTIAQLLEDIQAVAFDTQKPVTIVIAGVDHDISDVVVEPDGEMFIIAEPVPD